ncbi:hypothetical protein MNEG_12006 [Monoraphidium neglectum]|uniref:Sm domain-containing protein n=1 Tax=Monoraphidium neglectum TaxID=145388 RepID=A0A0D2J861_9CHLO|nr:hypothetical protein MNEG_12006 [Monoraphidium neglectum]KIY95957.1 hypothetical protein MNEG_12006 [Monoraphidium neglectum]|eukprot:XP_013894977.1 hypothetical protein MNEG_12006 [Monoraphidium neglectum]
MADGGDTSSMIGSLISLISKSQIRYEGVLVQISIETSAITLSNVRSFGTESRRPSGQQVPPSDQVYEYIVFKGDDIQELTVLENKAAPLPSDPAILSAQPAPPAPPPPLFPPPGAFPGAPPGAPPPFPPARVMHS